MASNINYASVDESFPVAGQDNDSQGFRDNFSTIKSSLASAKSEITDLQEDAAKLNINNNFNATEISNAKLRNTPYVYFNKNINESETHELLITDGHYQQLNINGTANIDLENFRPPAGAQVVYKVQILINGTGTVKWLTGSPSNIFRVNSTWPKRINPSNTFNVTTNQPVLVDIWTTDGITFYGFYYGNLVTITSDDVSV
jgi:hypothetical protein